MELLKDAEAKERHLRNELIQADKELASLKKQVNLTLQKLEEAMQQIRDLEQRNSATQSQFSELRTMLDDRTRMAERAAQNNRHLEEDLNRMRNRLSKASATTNDTELSQLCNEYKSLLKCTSCQRNFKSHVLQRCMHVFCKPCIDSRIETRQRKCPTCGDAFGTGDVKQIFL